MEYYITDIKHYPDDGNHQECIIDLPFEIRRGEDGYVYHDKKGVEHKYNMRNKLDKRWVVHLTDTSNESLSKLFEIKCNKDLTVILNYCIRLYKKSLKMELKRVSTKLIKI